MSDAFIYANPDLKIKSRRILDPGGRPILNLTVGVPHPFHIHCDKGGDDAHNSILSKSSLRLLACLARVFQLLPVLLGLIGVGGAEFG
jgi:hypothetical protein